MKQASARHSDSIIGSTTEENTPNGSKQKPRAVKSSANTDQKEKRKTLQLGPCLEKVKDLLQGLKSRSHGSEKEHTH